MIRISGLNLSYGNNEVLKNIELNINEPGIYFIYGESGSGKSSLLNILSLMEDRYEGEFYFDEENVSFLSKEEKQRMRFEKITYIFQMPKLIENESVITNLEVALGKKLTKEEIKNLLSKINLKNGNKKISVLSGGEKQRVNILMGILRDTPVILGDEITSGLDETNKKVIMSLLKEEAKRRIIILVSHDEKIISKYARVSRKIENKTMDKIEAKKKKMEKKENKKENVLPLQYAIKHVFTIVSSKKIRTMITTFSSLIAFVCLGICLILTSSLQDSIMSSLGNVVKENQIVMEQKEESYLIEENISISKKDIMRIKEKYNSSMEYLGVNYLSDVDMMFEDANYFSYVFDTRYKNIQGLKIGAIKDFIPIQEEENDLFYLSNDKLQEDEIVLSLPHGEISRLCLELGYEYVDDSSLLKALIDNPIEVKMFATNEEWEYDLEASFYLVGYTISDDIAFYHTDSLWSEYVYEEIMQLESSLALSEDSFYPWTLKKEYYLYTSEKDGQNLLEVLLEDYSLNDFVVKCFKKEYGYGLSFEYAHNNYMKISECNNLVDAFPYLDSFIPCSSLGYNAIGDVLMAGFTYPTFISQDYELIEEFININSYSEENLGAYQSTILSMTNDNILSLSLLDSTKSNYCRFNVDNATRFNNVNSIGVSTGLLKKIGVSNNSTSTPLFIMYLKNIEYANGRYRNEFEIVKVNVSHVVENKEIAIYQTNLWPMTFLATNFETKCAGIEKSVLNYCGNDLENDLIELNEKYQKFIFSAPYLEYSKNIEEVENYLVGGLSLFSSFCLLSTLLMLIVSSNLFISEIRKEIGIYSLYGYEDKSIKRLYKLFSYFLSFYSLILSYISLVVICMVLEKTELLISVSVTNAIGIPFLIMFITSLVIGFVSSRASTYHVFKENPLMQLQEK